METIAVWCSSSPAETERLGERFSETLRSGDVVAYLGGLGMGKTAFTAGVAKGLGITDAVSSPTYALVNVYFGSPDLVHFDMYRVSTPEDLEATGFFDYLDTGAVLAVEWSENILSDLPKKTIFVKIEPGETENQRVITIQRETEKSNRHETACH